MDIETIGTPALWIGFIAFVVLMLALDLGIFNRRAHVISVKEAAIWSGVWVLLALGFNLFVFLRWGAASGEAFLTGYLIEKALSVDNLFVFFMIFTSFSVPAAYQHRLLFWGIVGAVVLRAIMIWGGTMLLTHFHWLVYIFGGILIATGVRMLARPGEEPHPEKSRLFRAIRRIVPTTREGQDHGSNIFVRENGALLATPLFLVLVLIELSDVVFAVDSILAIFAITEDPFIVFTSNIFAIMGMRSLYFVLAGVATRFVYLQPGLAMVLLFVGAKMVASPFVKIPVLVSLMVVSVLLGGSIVASLIKDRSRRKLPSTPPSSIKSSARTHESSSTKP
jgi:tellurite resistance protein TerC